MKEGQDPQPSDNMTVPHPRPEGSVSDANNLPGLRAHAARREPDRGPGQSTRGISEDEVGEKIMLTEPAIKRLIEPEEVAKLAAFLCTPQASFITGAFLTMDGGATAH